MKKNLIYNLTLTLMSFTLYSCDTVDITSIACESFKSGSSITNELLQSPDSIIIDDKEFKLYVESNKTYSIAVREFPDNFAPTIKNNCTDNITIYIYSQKNTVKYQEVYIPEKIWFINKENQVWESNKFVEFKEPPLNIDYIKDKFHVIGKAPNTRNTVAIVKFKYKDKSFYLKTSNIFRSIYR